MTARLATHADVATRVQDVRARLEEAGVDIEVVNDEPVGGGGSSDPLAGVWDGTVDLALVGIDALRGSAADGLTTVAVLPRDEFRDVVLALGARSAPLDSLPAGSRVGVHGARRRALLLAHRPDLEPVPLAHGGVTWPPRDELDAAIVGAVEVREARLSDRIAEALDPRTWLPEPGKGALALVARYPIAEATALDHLPTRTALRAELALVDALELGPDSSLGSFAQTTGRWIRLWAAVVAEDGTRIVRSDRTGPLDEPEALGAGVARQIRERGMELVLPGAGASDAGPVEDGS